MEYHYPEDLCHVLYDDVTTNIKIIFKFKFINPNTLKYSDRITNFVFEDFIKHIQNDIIQGSTNHRIDAVTKTVENELFKYFMDLIDRGTIYRFGEGFLVDKTWFFTQLLNGRQYEII